MTTEEDKSLAIRCYFGGWPISEITETYGVPRSTLYKWFDSETPESSPPILHEKTIKSRGVYTEKRFTDIPEEDVENMKMWLTQARKVSNRTPVDAPERLYSEKLNHYIKLHTQRMVPVSVISRYLKITPRAVRVRRDS